MPCFDLLLVLQCYLLILSPHLLHDLGHVLPFRSVNIHTDASLGDLDTQFCNFLLWGK